MVVISRAVWSIATYHTVSTTHVLSGTGSDSDPYKCVCSCLTTYDDVVTNTLVQIALPISNRDRPVIRIRSMTVYAYDLSADASFAWLGPSPDPVFKSAPSPSLTAAAFDAYTWIYPDGLSFPLSREMLGADYDNSFGAGRGLLLENVASANQAVTSQVRWYIEFDYSCDNPPSAPETVSVTVANLRRILTRP